MLIMVLPVPESAEPVRRSVTVRFEHGLHLSPCSRLSQLAQKHPAAIRLRHGAQTADAKSVLDLMTLAAGPGSELELEVHGPDALVAADQVVEFFEQHTPKAAESSEPQ